MPAFTDVGGSDEQTAALELAALSLNGDNWYKAAVGIRNVHGTFGSTPAGAV